MMNFIYNIFGIGNNKVSKVNFEDVQNFTKHKKKHHLLINVDSIDYYLPIPSSNQHIHFGLGQTETQLNLPPGKHQLQLILGDKYHVPHQPPLVSRKIQITVTE